MPIRKENKARYPKDWPQIREWIRQRSGDRCECTGQCGKDHGLTPESAGVRCQSRNHMPIDEIEGPCIVLTVAHLDHQPENNNPSNLLHLCQGCHNRYDAPMRAAGIRARRRALQADGDLFP